MINRFQVSIRGITNPNEFYSDHYLDEILVKDLKDLVTDGIVPRSAAVRPLISNAVVESTVDTSGRMAAARVMGSTPSPLFRKTVSPHFLCRYPSVGRAIALIPFWYSASIPRPTSRIPSWKIAFQ
ncbi:MAG: hypothetical protein KAJ98_06760 [Spirochaetaceae bacterium]|nr:hypothetical protein [Spirochaetaceae bacterium]